MMNEIYRYNKSRLSKVLLLLMVSIVCTLYGASAQSARIRLGDISCEKGATVMLPVYLDNPMEVVALQFTISDKPQVISYGKTIEVSNRGEDHVAVVSTNLGDKTVMIYSPSNKALKDSVGIVARIPVEVVYGKEGSQIQMTLKNVVLTDKTGKAIECEAEGCKVSVETLPKLSVEALTQEVEEGKTFVLRVTTSQAPSASLPIAVESDLPSRFFIPRAEIRAGETSTEVQVSAKEDNEPDIDRDIVFTVSAAKHHSATCEVTLLDNDLPELSLEMTPAEVNEGDGPRSIKAIVSRKDHIDAKVKVKLTDNSNGALSYSARSLDFAPGEKSKEVYLGPVDNKLAEGDRTYKVTAAVWISSCGCLSNGESRGAVTKEVAVHDNDGPALELTADKTTIKEGETLKITLKRNDAATKTVNVSLSTGMTSGFICPTSVMLNKGVTSSTFSVKAMDNKINGDAFDVTISASAEGYAGSSLWLHVSDATLPDASAKSLSLTPAKVYPGSEMTATLTVKNIGTYELPASTKVSFLLEGKLLGTVALGNIVQAGGETNVTYDFAVPDEVKTLELRARINAGNAVKEVSYNNQDIVRKFSVSSPFYVNVSVDKNVIMTGEKVNITGKLNGERIDGQPVNVYVSSGGVKQTLHATSDAEGKFSVEYEPPITGAYGISAAYPKQEEPYKSCTFNVYGLTVGSAFSKLQLKEGETQSVSIKLTNDSPDALTGISVTPGATPDDIELNIENPTVIGGGKSIDIKLSVVGKNVTASDDWTKIPLKIKTQEGLESEHLLYCYVQRVKGKVECSEPRIESTVSVETSREYPIVLRNVGGSPTGKLTVDTGKSGLISSITPTSYPSVAPGDSIHVLLRFNPIENLEAGEEYSGNIAIHCESCDDILIPYNLTAVAESNGVLKLDVVDNFTFYTEGSPHVANAKIRVMRSATSELVAEGYTGADGIFSAELPPARYTVSVTADKHPECEVKRWVHPGVENAYEIFLDCENVTYEWDAEHSEVDDTYSGTVSVNFDTDVPMPRILVTMPSTRPDVGDIFQVTASNTGLIAVEDFEIGLGVSEGMKLTFMNSPVRENLAAGEEVNFYVKLEEDTNAADVVMKSQARAAEDSQKCLDIRAKGQFKYICGKYVRPAKIEGRSAWGKCSKQELNNNNRNDGRGSTGSGGASGPGSPTPDSNISYSADSDMPDISEDPIVNCNPKSVPMKPLDLVDPWPVVPDGEPGELPCGERPVLSYKLVNPTTRAERTGVAADGCSQLMLVLEKGSSIPSEDCDYTIEWKVDDKYGVILNENAWNEILFVVADKYPGKELREAVELEFKITGTWKAGDATGTVEIPVKMAHAPLLLLHDYDTDERSWEPFRQHLINPESGAPMYRDWQVDNTSYAGFRAYYDNSKVAYRRIMRLLQNYLLKGFEAHQADVIGHGTGGIIARLCAQELERPDLIHKLITLNTPHSGSEYYDLSFLTSVVNFPPGRVFEFGSNLIMSLLSPNKSCAMWDMGANNSTTDDKVNGPTKSQLIGVPITTLATHNPDCEAGAAFLQGFGTVLSWIPTPYNIAKIVGTVMTASGELMQSYMPCDDFIPIDSQLGGCLSGTQLYPAYGFSGLHHNDNPRDKYVVWPYLESLLVADSDTKAFSKAGLNPPDRSFSALDVATDIMKSVLLDKIGMSKPVKDWLLKNPSVAALGEDFVDLSMDASSPVVDGVKNLVCEFGKNLFNNLTTNNNKEKVKSRESEVESNNPVIDIILFTSIDGDKTYYSYNKELSIEVPGWYEGTLDVYALYRTKDDTWYNESMAIDTGVALCTLDSIEAKPVELDDDEPGYPVVTCHWSNGEVSYVKPESVAFGKPIASYSDGEIMPKMTGETTITFTYKGKTCDADLKISSLPAPQAPNVEETDNSICSSVKLEIGQTMTMARQAVRGTLTVNNGNPTAALEDFNLDLVVKDENGNKVDDTKFAISLESLEDGFLGIPSLGNPWSLYAGSVGTARILFVPTVDAAPTAPVNYYFGGSFSYLDSETGILIKHDLDPVKLTVNPSPYLNLDYFLESSIWGDDPMTEAVVEPSVEAEMALMIANVGAGDVSNLRLTTTQPQIVDNEKGLSIDFDIVRSSLNGGECVLAMGQDIPTVLGEMPSGSTSVAQWWLKSSLSGRIKEYDVKFNHVTDFGNPNTSLIGEVRCHNLVRSVTTNDANLTVGFAVNDIADDMNMPDFVYLPNGVIQTVAKVKKAEVMEEAETYVLHMIPSSTGWNYGEMPDPTGGTCNLVSVKRVSDGEVMSLRNFWLTDRVFKDKKISYENVLHFMDFLDSDSETAYELTFEKKPFVELQVVEVEGIPAADNVASEPVRNITVRFNKPVAPKAFTTDALSFDIDGENVDVEDVVITTDNNIAFSISLSEVGGIDSGKDYTLRINLAKLADTDGVFGQGEYVVTWKLGHAMLEDIYSDEGEFNVSTLDGILLFKAATKHDLETLDAGIYVINGKTVILK